MSQNIRRTNKLYNTTNIDSQLVSKVKRNREYLLSRYVADELNTYRTWEVFGTFNDIHAPDDLKAAGSAKLDSAAGVRSIFNKAGAVMLGNNGKDVTKTSSSWRMGNNVPLMDSPGVRKAMRDYSKCTIRDLVDASGKGQMGQETYAYSDFMYCKHLGKISNSYLVTLRRFPIPVDDHISATGLGDHREKFKSENPVSMGCMVTWMGTPGNDLSSILKYNFSMPFKEQKADFQDAGDAHNGNGLLNKVAACFDKSYRDNVMAGYQTNPVQDYANAFLPKWAQGGSASYDVGKLSDHYDRNKVYGPIDAVKTTYMRAEDGLKFGQSFNLVFDYELRSYDGINPRQAMLDLISNILTVTYTSGTFWGGGYRGTGQARNNIFNNFKVFQAKGGFTEMMDALLADVQGVTKTFEGKFMENGKLNFKSLGQAIKSALNQVGGMLMGGMLNKLGRPQKLYLNSLLSPAPIGLWHVTIGNPKHPIMSLGNMILKNTTIEHYGPLGIDEFPTGLRVTCELERGKPRDLRDIEKIYMNGNDRIFHSMTGHIADMYQHAKEYKGSKYYSNNKGNADTDPNTTEVENNTERKELDDVLMKYFGTKDKESLIFTASEQEWGSQKKKVKEEEKK